MPVLPLARHIDVDLASPLARGRSALRLLDGQALDPVAGEDLTDVASKSKNVSIEPGRDVQRVSAD